MTSALKPKIGLALGSGSARGMAHVGIIRELETIGIRPDIICGSSVGSLIGAACILGKMQELCSCSGCSTRETYDCSQHNGQRTRRRSRHAATLQLQ